MQTNWIILLVAMISSFISGGLVEYLLDRILPPVPRIKHVLAIVVAIMVFALIAAKLPSGLPGAQLPTSTLTLQVRVRSAYSGDDIADADVRLLLSNLPPFTAVTGTDGLAYLEVNRSTETIGRLTVIADGYEQVNKDINLNQISHEILLEPES